MLFCVYLYLCVHTAGVSASVGDFIAANTVTLTRYLLYCQKLTQQPHQMNISYQHGAIGFRWKCKQYD